MEGIIDSNVDPHDYDFRPSDAVAIAEADIILRSGLGLDDWLDDLVEDAGEGASVIETSQGLTLTESSEDVDPHVWLNPDLTLVIIDNITNALAEVDPGNAENYLANAEIYKDQVRAMAARVEETLSACGQDERKLVASHDALGHFAERFGLRVVGAVIPSLETTAEPSAADLGELIELIEEQDVAAIFSEASVSTELEEQVASETGARVISDLYLDSLGPDGSVAETYISMMEFNARAIVDGLGCR